MVMNPDHVWVCNACGKTNTVARWHVADFGWDESCAMNAALCLTSSLKRDDHGRVVGAEAVPIELEKAQKKAERDETLAAKEGR